MTASFGALIDNLAKNTQHEGTMKMEVRYFSYEGADLAFGR